ncbi:flagellar assembly peptidoglycan hydrolase FlgJ [Pantoea sp.]|uniref:flagellar assembly peptidoglycan hydrolase FlgJ n=1 Tax=Pantoea sp. TaxID=69393 RepID=UPI00289663A6|nr:flagellar assembly peptidoglycan hydrolase FlgJ [Pantoea sp.]
MNTSPLISGAAFDTHGLDALKREVKTGSPDAIKAAAKQMEGLFVQMMLKSMRQASLKGGLFNSQESETFTSMYDQQIAQDIAAQGKMGFADLMIKQWGGDATVKTNAPGAAPAPYALNAARQRTPFPASPQSGAASGNNATMGAGGNDDFISRLLGPAIHAAKQSGIPHQLIIAQAALESGWGNREITTAEGKPSHNLFGIKATPDWKGKSTEVVTTEYLHGVAQKVKANFRVYSSYADALADYASLLTRNPRYQDISRAGSAEKAAHTLQRGGYATDPNYADKLINIIKQVKGNVSHALNAYNSDLSSLF